MVWKKVTWAVDPFARDSGLQRSALQALRVLAGEGTVIEPVYLLNSSPGGAIQMYSGKYLKELQRSAHEKYQELIRPISQSGLLPLKLLIYSFATLHGGVEALINYVKESESELIVASTHAKKGPNRWLTGSFAETLMVHSDVPLLVVNPRWELKAVTNEIVFPTDFSAVSRAAFDRVVVLAKNMNCGITLFHKLPTTMAPLFDTELSGYPVYEVTVNSQTEFARKKAHQWQDAAKSKGVNVRVEIHSELSGTPAEAILNYAESRNCVIAMAARSGPISAAILGSTTRRVVRGSISPVWVVHPDLAQKAQAA
jgi:nucleotide-binding universal stress UspA family protein